MKKKIQEGQEVEHSPKWSDRNRRSNSHNAGMGNRGSRNQGTGIAGKANTIATDLVDTTKMSPEQKLKYFQSLGLMPGNVKEEVKEPHYPQDSQGNVQTGFHKSTTQAIMHDLKEIFAEHPDMVRSIIDNLKRVHPSKYKQALVAAYQELHKAIKETRDPHEVQERVLDVIFSNN